MLIRERVASDEDALVRMARAVRELDGYPLSSLPSEQLGGYLMDASELSAWVAEEDGVLIGHVALHPRGSGPVMNLAAESLAAPPEDLALVARLLVDPATRRHGVGLRLLSTAAADAWSRGLRPILDVATVFESAVGLYESAGWQRLGQVQVTLGDGTVVDEHVYAAPPPREG